MNQRNWIFLLMALVSLALVTLACHRSSQKEPTLSPSATSPAAAPPPVLPSRTPSPTATITPSPTPTPTPPPLPIVLIERAAGALHNGDYAAARAIYRSLPVENLDESEAALARWGLAQSLLEDEDYVAAAGAWRDFLAWHPDHPRVPDAHFLLAEALMGSGEYLAAVDEYRAYLAERDVIAPYVHLWIGDAYTFAGSYDDAVSAYQQALAQSPTLDLTFQAREKMALAHNYVGDYTDALAQYDAILAATQDEGLHARMQYQAAQTLLVAGEREAAYTRLYDLVTNYYKTPAAYNALVDLINSDQPVDEFQRGLVDYYNDAYDAAVAAFYRAIEADLEGHDGALHYFAGLTYRAAGNYAAAVAEFEVLLDTHPDDPYVDDTWLAKAWTQYLADDDETAVETYTRFVEDNPTNGLAPEALWWAANIRFWNDDYERAEALFTPLATDYATNEHAADALYRAAFCRYRLGDYAGAEEAWRRYTVKYRSAELAIGAHFWRGRAYLAAGETVSATAAFSQTVAAGPLDYYSQRALDYLADLEPGAPSALRTGAGGEADIQPRPPFVERPLDLSLARARLGAPTGAPSGDDEADERAATDEWLADWLGLKGSEAITISQLSPPLAADPRLQRGQELWRLGRRAEAKEELEWLRRDTATDLRAQYQLAIFFRELGLYRSSILAAEAAIRLSPARSPFDAPPFLARLAYPVYYADLVLLEAETNDLDPLLLFALIRQESLFEGFATSYAYAYGLMQIIPSTGQGIANSLGWAGYETADLYHPFISVKFGTWYLAQQWDTFDGLFYPALSAYNGGPGNARRWLNRALTVCPDEAEPDACPFDYDVFVEIIHLYETRLYIRQIYKHFAVYQHLYSEAPGP
jgi:soluble lytic murein transglycosylase